MQIPAQFEANDADAWHALGVTRAASRDFNYDPPQSTI
jgi:hypothetical protein